MSSSTAVTEMILSELIRRAAFYFCIFIFITFSYVRILKIFILFLVLRLFTFLCYIYFWFGSRDYLYFHLMPSHGCNPKGRTFQTSEAWKRSIENMVRQGSCLLMAVFQCVVGWGGAPCSSERGVHFLHIELNIGYKRNHRLSQYSYKQKSTKLFMRWALRSWLPTCFIPIFSEIMVRFFYHQT